MYMKCWGKLLAVFLIGLQIPSYSFAQSKITPEQHIVHVAQVKNFLLQVSQIEDCLNPLITTIQKYYCQLYKNHFTNGFLEPEENWNTEIGSSMASAGLIAIFVSDIFLYRYELIAIEKLGALDEILLSDRERLANYFAVPESDRRIFYPRNKSLNKITTELFSSISVKQEQNNFYVTYQLRNSADKLVQHTATINDLSLIYQDLSKIPSKQHHAYMLDFIKEGRTFVHETPAMFSYKVRTYYPKMLVKMKTRNFLKIVGYPLSAIGIGLLIWEHMFLHDHSSQKEKPTPQDFLGWVKAGDIESIQIYLLDPFPQIAKDMSDKISTIPQAWNDYNALPVHLKKQ